ncbi:hypothetical protein LEP1GSC124_3241 [Leptospira interrogans serovar Pyrogenes str. 200701872]|uniref:Uncharacterized protein n=1 Tax=Leptospira interrogans serovar Pyrogenes str. 200701872 TaxID=1193029 RepID=M6ZNJ8_LEPIR|nr:hypothetical protein LEP1GSC124_3241 [Leptospira interrogans serovar Pyrogenes str. 200701872]
MFFKTVTNQLFLVWNDLKSDWTIWIFWVCEAEIIWRDGKFKKLRAGFERENFFFRKFKKFGQVGSCFDSAISNSAILK